MSRRPAHPVRADIVVAGSGHDASTCAALAASLHTAADRPGRWRGGGGVDVDGWGRLHRCDDGDVVVAHHPDRGSLRVRLLEDDTGIEFPWIGDADAHRRLRPLAAIRLAASAARACAVLSPPSAAGAESIVRAAAAILSADGIAVRTIVPPTPLRPIRAIGVDLRPVAHPALDRIGRLCPTVLAVCRAHGHIVLQGAPFDCGPGDPLDPAADPIATLRDVADLRRRLDGASS